MFAGVASFDYMMALGVSGIASELLFLVEKSANTDLPPIGFCMLFLLGSKYAGVFNVWMFRLFSMGRLLKSKRFLRNYEIAQGDWGYS